MAVREHSKNRIDAAFSRLRDTGSAGFVAYVTAGDPGPASTPEIVRALADAGSDVVELGIPFSDPLADGATIQAASARALSAGMTVGGVLDVVRDVRRDCDVPLVLFTYLNPIFSFGLNRFFSGACDAGADGVLVLDWPPDEAALGAVDAMGLKRIRLVAPTTPPLRMASICAEAEGFVYYVSREGVTGEQNDLADGIAAQVDELRRHTPLPVAVGFGISRPDQAAAVAREADAAVVGSAIVRTIADHAGNAATLPEHVAAFVRPLADAVHQARART